MREAHPLKRVRRGSAPTDRAELLADTELLDDGAVALDVDLDQVVQQAATLTYQHFQRPRGVEVLVIGLHVLRQVADAIGEQRDLALGRSGVRFRFSVLLKDLLLFR